MITKGCHSCKWDDGTYCNRPGGSDCNWVGEIFRGEYNSWIHWEPRIKNIEKPTLSQTLRILANELEKRNL